MHINLCAFDGFAVPNHTTCSTTPNRARTWTDARVWDRLNQMASLLRSWFGMGTVAGLALLHIASPAFADAPIWANAKVVKATQTDCGSNRYLVFKGNAVRAPTPPDAPGCKSTERVYRQINVSQAFFRPKGKGPISEQGVDAATLLCSNGDALIIVGRGREVDLAVRGMPAPRGCAYNIGRLQHVSSVGSIPFTDVANGGTMSVKESLAFHAEERRRIIAECNASAACRAEMSRINRERAIAAFNECMKPGGETRVCSRPK